MTPSPPFPFPPPLPFRCNFIETVGLGAISFLFRQDLSGGRGEEEGRIGRREELFAAVFDPCGSLRLGSSVSTVYFV